MSTEEYVNIAKNIYGDLFSYANSIYVNSKTNIEIKCNRHDQNFAQNPSHHLRHNGCKFCREDKSKKTLLEKYGVDHPSKISESKQKLKNTWANRTALEKSQIRAAKQMIWSQKTAKEKADIQIKKEKTFFEKYGYSNPFDDQLVKEKISALRTARGDWTANDQLTPLEQYKRIVWKLTERTYKENKNLIDPEKRRSKNFHLDHITAITVGFRNKIQPEIIAAKENLQILSATDNRRKGNR